MPPTRNETPRLWLSTLPLWTTVASPFGPVRAQLTTSISCPDGRMSCMWSAPTSPLLLLDEAADPWPDPGSPAGDEQPRDPAAMARTSAHAPRLRSFTM